MEFIIDTINLEEIKDAIEYLPLVGVTSNPSIVKKVSPANFYDHMREIRKIIGKKRSVHIQVIATDYEGILAEAKNIHKAIDKDVYIKVPVNKVGLKAIKALKAEGYKVTATAVYDLMQAYLALEAGADYIAPYVNRMSNLGTDPYGLIDNVSYRIATDNYDCKVVAASFKNLQQIKDAFNAGANSITASYDLLMAVFNNPNIDKAVKDFNTDWKAMYGDKSLNDV